MIFTGLCVCVVIFGLVCVCAGIQRPLSAYMYAGGVCHSTLCNAVNPCLGEIRSLIRQPQGLHSVITLNPPHSHHHTALVHPVGLQVGWCKSGRVCVCANAGRGALCR